MNRIRSRLTLFVTGALVGAAALAGCAANQSDTLRSPSLDYQPPPPTAAADGEVVGADQVPPGQKIAEGARVGTDPQPAPGWQATDQGLQRDPNGPVGGHVATPAK